MIIILKIIYPKIKKLIMIIKFKTFLELGMIMKKKIIIKQLIIIYLVKSIIIIIRLIFLKIQIMKLIKIM